MSQFLKIDIAWTGPVEKDPVYEARKKLQEIIRKGLGFKKMDFRHSGTQKKYSVSLYSNAMHPEDSHKNFREACDICRKIIEDWNRENEIKIFEIYISYKDIQRT